MKIAIIGNPYFAKKIKKDLSNHDKQNSYIFYNTSGNLFDKIRFIISLPFIDVVYSIGATLVGGGALKLALFFNKRIVQHFIGSDVLQAAKDFKEEKINKKLILKTHFLCETKWIKDELKELGIDSDICVFCNIDRFVKPKKFENFSVLTYIPANKERFYGIDDYIKLAKEFPKIEFKIAGLKSYKNLPKNIKTLGWCNLLDELQNSTIYIRNTYHDGLAFSVIEALSLGRIVFRNKRFDFVVYFEDYHDLKREFINILNLYKDGNLDINHNAIDFVKDKFSSKKVLDELKKRLISG